MRKTNPSLAYSLDPCIYVLSYVCGNHDHPQVHIRVFVLFGQLNCTIRHELLHGLHHPALEFVLCTSSSAQSSRFHNVNNVWYVFQRCTPYVLIQVFLHFSSGYLVYPKAMRDHDAIAHSPLLQSNKERRRKSPNAQTVYDSAKTICNI